MSLSRMRDLAGYRPCDTARFWSVTINFGKATSSANQGRWKGYHAGGTVIVGVAKLSCFAAVPIETL